MQLRKKYLNVVANQIQSLKFQKDPDDLLFQILWMILFLMTMSQKKLLIQQLFLQYHGMYIQQSAVARALSRPAKRMFTFCFILFSRPQQKDLVKARKQGFAKIVMDIKKVSENAKGFWRSLPYTMCGQPDPTIQDEYWNR